MSESVLFFVQLASSARLGIERKTHFSKPVLFRLKKYTRDVAIVMSAAAAAPRPALVTHVSCVYLEYSFRRKLWAVVS